jgi:hypothetical protein
MENLTWNDLTIVSGKTVSKLDDKIFTLLTEGFGFDTPTKV